MQGTTNQPTEYSARFVLPDLIERGRANTLRCPVYLDGDLVAPSAGTVSIFDATGAAQVSGASVTITGDVATYSYAPATSLPLADDWRVEWTLTISGASVFSRNDAALVRARLRNPVSDQDLYSKVSALDPNTANVIHSKATLQDYLDSSWHEIQRRLINRGRRPWLIMSPSALYDVALNLGLSYVYDDLGPTAEYVQQAIVYRERYESKWGELNFRYDDLDEGKASPDRRRSASSTTWLCGRG